MNWKLYAGGAVAAIVAVSSAHAQQTSSVVTGQVTDASGAAIAGATVTIIHVPSGTAKTVTTSENGVYFASGLRVGGPFEFSASANGQVGSRSNISLKPGTGNVVGIRVAEIADTIVVRGEVGSSIDLNNGAGSSFDRDAILGQPATSRNLINTLVRDPLAFSSGGSTLSVAGVNPRFNALAIDGSLQQDDFGLSSSTFPTTRSPISLDVVEVASVAASDYSVKSSGFSGGFVNVVTKSGGNEFNGALYYYRQDEDNFGNAAFDQFVDRAPFLEEEYGFQIDGPIIKDKLFFNVSYDKFETGSSQNFTQSDANANRDPAVFDLINQLVEDSYGFDLGGRPTVASLPEETERLFAKLDWNITEDHRASFTYQNTEETNVNGVGATNFVSAYYDAPSELNAYTFQLFSDWTDQLSTEFRVNYKEFERGQNCRAGDGVGEFDIRLSENDLNGTQITLSDGTVLDFDGLVNEPGVPDTNDVLFLTGGCDRFRQGNTFEDERLQVFGAANYALGDHFFTGGFEYQSYELDNLFAQRSVGEFRYTSLQDLQNQVANRVEAQLPDTGVREDIRAVWGYDQIALFAQDSWQVLPELRIDLGVRYERIIQDDEPQARSFFASRYGFANSVNLDGNDLIMPRISFEYTPFERTRVTGGFGLFGGGDPKVWTSNAFTPPVFFGRVNNVANADPTVGTPQDLLNVITANDANDPGPIDVISSDFETPSDWKASLKVDQEFDLNFADVLGGPEWLNFGSDYLFSFQLLYSFTNQGFRWENLADTTGVDLGGGDNTSNIGIAPDGRPIYADLDDLGVNNAIALTNFDEGRSIVLSAALSKDFDSGLGLFASYTYQDVETVTPGTSSRGVSNFRAIVDADRNNPGAFTSPFEIEHAFKVNASYEREFAGLMSRFSVFGQITSGEPFTYTFNTGTTGGQNNFLFGSPGDGETPFDAAPLYVPTIVNGLVNDPNVVLASGFNEAGFVNTVQNLGISSGIHDRNSDQGSWNQRWDFQWQQEIPFFSNQLERFVGDNRLLFVVDVINFPNLLNDDWGRQFSAPGNNQLPLVSADLVSAADVAANGIDGASALLNDQSRTVCTTADACLYRFNSFDDTPITASPSLNGSVWSARFGLRYEF